MRRSPKASVAAGGAEDNDERGVCHGGISVAIHMKRKQPPQRETRLSRDMLLLLSGGWVGEKNCIAKRDLYSYDVQVLCHAEL